MTQTYDAERADLGAILAQTTWLLRGHEPTRDVAVGPIQLQVRGARHLAPDRNAGPDLDRVVFGSIVVAVHRHLAARNRLEVVRFVEKIIGPLDASGPACGWELARGVFADLGLALRLLAFGQSTGLWEPELRDLTPDIAVIALSQSARVHPSLVLH